MSIYSYNREAIIKVLKERGDHVFSITKEVIYAIPHEKVSHYIDYNDFLKFANKHPFKVFTNYYQVKNIVKDVKEL